MKRARAFALSSLRASPPSPDRSIFFGWPLPDDKPVAFPRLAFMVIALELAHEGYALREGAPCEAHLVRSDKAIVAVHTWARAGETYPVHPLAAAFGLARAAHEVIVEVLSYTPTP